MMNTSRQLEGFSLLELLAVVTMLGLVAAAILPRVSSSHDESKRQNCFVNQGDIEIQVEIWWHNNESLPQDDLADIGATLDYFPEGVPTCPVDGTSYTIDPTTGRVIGHNH